MKRTIKKNAGFSLVELMVVIAIIGVLATIAIPKYNVFIAKSRTSEAESNLAGIYSFNKNFFTEYNGYASDLKCMGFHFEGKVRYNTGFSASAVPTNYASQNGSACAYTAWNSRQATMCFAPGGTPTTAIPCVRLAGSDGNDVPVMNTTYTSPPAAASGFGTFKAESIGMITGTTIADVWSLDENKQLTHNVDGTGG